MELMRQKAPCLSTVRLPDKSKTESAVQSHNEPPLVPAHPPHSARSEFTV